MSVIVNSKFEHHGIHFELSVAEETADTAATAYQHLYQGLTGNGLDVDPQPAESPTATAPAESTPAPDATTQAALPPSNGATPPPMVETPPPAAQAPAVASADDPAITKAKQLLAMDDGEAKLTDILTKIGAQTVGTVPKEHHDVLIGWLDHYLAGGTGEQPATH